MRDMAMSRQQSSLSIRIEIVAALEASNELEADTQTELNLAGSAERVDAGPDTDAIYVVITASGAIDLPRSSRQNSIQGVARQIEVREVEEVVEADARLHGELFTKPV
jgi:hypothetical protein